MASIPRTPRVDVVRAATLTPRLAIAPRCFAAGVDLPHTVLRRVREHKAARAVACIVQDESCSLGTPGLHDAKCRVAVATPRAPAEGCIHKLVVHARSAPGEVVRHLLRRVQGVRTRPAAARLVASYRLVQPPPAQRDVAPIDGYVEWRLQAIVPTNLLR